MIETTLTGIVIITLAVLCFANGINSIKRAGQNNNYLAIRYRNIAITYGFLCIALIIAFMLNQAESSNNLNNCPMDVNNAITTHHACPWAVQKHGFTVARVNFKST